MACAFLTVVPSRRGHPARALTTPSSSPVGEGDALRTCGGVSPRGGGRGGHGCAHPAAVGDGPARPVRIAVLGLGPRGAGARCRDAASPRSPTARLRADSRPRRPRVVAHRRAEAIAVLRTRWPRASSPQWVTPRRSTLPEAGTRIRSTDQGRALSRRSPATAAAFGRGPNADVAHERHRYDQRPSAPTVSTSLGPVSKVSRDHTPCPGLRPARGPADPAPAVPQGHRRRPRLRASAPAPSARRCWSSPAASACSSPGRPYPTLQRYGWSFFTESPWQPEADVLGIARGAGRHRLGRAGRDGLRVPARAADGALHQRVRPGAAQADAGLAGRPDGRRAVDRLRAVGLLPGHAARRRARPLAAAATSAGSRSSTSTPTRTPPSGTQSRYVASAFCAGIAVAMMVMPMACAVMRQVFSQTPARREGGRARARRHPLGHDPLGRPALRPRRHHRRHDARPRPGARRDHRGRC